MDNWIVIGILVLILGSVGFFLWKSRKKGMRCIGCPDSGHCSGSCGSCGKKP